MTAHRSRSVGLFVGAVFALSLLSGGPSNATLLIFEPETGAFPLDSAIPQGYGDRVVSTVQDGFHYGLDGGATPNVVASYVSAFAGLSSYADLVNVAHTDALTGLMEIELAADPGFVVRIRSFNVGGFGPNDYNINAIRVFDQDDAALYETTSQHVEGDGFGPPHSVYLDACADFTQCELLPELVGSRLTIKVDASNLGQRGAVGFDNVIFEQSAVRVPEPGSLVLFVLGVAGLLTMRRIAACEPCARSSQVNRP